VFVLRGLYGWYHETSLVEYLTQHPDFREQLGLKTIPDQSTLWRSWHQRFTPDLRDTVVTAARTILTKAQNAGVAVPRQPDQRLPSRGDEEEGSALGDQAVLDEAAPITDHVSRVVFPAFSLERGDGCEIHENAYWDLQTHLGFREGLAANEGARSFSTSQSG
jgi:hypothetical protein